MTEFSDVYKQFQPNPVRGRGVTVWKGVNPKRHIVSGLNNVSVSYDFNKDLVRHKRIQFLKYVMVCLAIYVTYRLIKSN